MLKTDETMQFVNVPTRPGTYHSYPQAQLQETMRTYVVFCVDQQRYALPLEHVKRALRMVALTPVPDAPVWVNGVINMAGQVIPVIDLRQRLGHPQREPEIEDRLLVVQIQAQTVALVVDEVLQVLELALHQAAPPPPALALSRPLVATIQQAEGLILVLDAARLLPLEQQGYQAP